ncbi:hypothetical protein E2986_11115 [Frieseomelitta varia]|uniref:Guanylate cyclase domain-containing protein n=1 Tax=Frieseomelitta varia TaxID=561572 RepID=A0A833VXV9_9HYME|nr:hypothetical protein E2986_11115 [Frieseomelitta varia]
MLTVNVLISAGKVTFSIIGDDRARHFLIAGNPIEDLKLARRICLPGDLMLSSSAWEHCAPSQYEYVIKDQNNIKVRAIRLDPEDRVLSNVLGRMESLRSVETIESIPSDQRLGESDVSLAFDISIDTEIHRSSFHMRASIIDVLRPNMSTYLRSFISKGVLTAVGFAIFPWRILRATKRFAFSDRKRRIVAVFNGTEANHRGPHHCGSQRMYRPGVDLSGKRALQHYSKKRTLFVVCYMTLKSLRWKEEAKFAIIKIEVSCFKVRASTLLYSSFYGFPYESQISYQTLRTVLCLCSTCKYLLDEMLFTVKFHVFSFPRRCSCRSFFEIVGSGCEVISMFFRSTIQAYFGCPGKAYLYEKDISFQIMYGMKGYESDGEYDNAKNGLLSASHMMKEIRRISNVKTILIGVSTGIAFCGVVGHSVRRQYMVFGTPVDKAKSLTMISLDKISCDYETFLSSALPKEKFRTQGMKMLRKIGKCHVYEFLDEETTKIRLSNLEYVYPILGRCKEMEYFKDILDDIGVAGRVYAGLLMEGPERCGKSRILDAFVTIVRNRQIKLVQLSLHPSYAQKIYATLYDVFLQLFDAENFSTIKNREKIISHKLSEVLNPEDFCYFNTIMRVQFPLSKEYCQDNDWQRHNKTIEMFDVILNEV